MIPDTSIDTVVEKNTKILLIEGSTELEAGIPPNLAVLVASVRNANFDIKVFSTNDYSQGSSTGDSRRVESLQVPPTNPEDIIYHVKETDVKEDFARIIEEFKPDVVGFSTTEATYVFGRELMRSIEDRTDIFRIVGGALPTLVPEEVLAESYVDAVCVGEGEKALVGLLQAIEDGKIVLDGKNHDPQNLTINNLRFKQPESGEIIVNQTILEDVNEVPFQDWSAWPIPPRASKTMRGKVSKTALVELTRGCPHKCNYCANVFFNEITSKHPISGKMQMFYRERSVDRFIEEVLFLRDKWGVEYLYVGDETIMTTSPARFQELVEKYPLTGVGIPHLEEAGKGLPFWCETRPESINYDRVKAFLGMGLSAINIGVESGNEEFRRTKLNRKVSNDRMIQGIGEAIRAGANIGSNVIIGFPGEDRGMIFETVELMRRALETTTELVGEEAAIKKLSTMIHLFQPYKKTPNRDDAVALGIIPPDYICGDYRTDAIGTGRLNADELLGLQRTFNLYVDLPRERWAEIELAEKFTPEGNAMFAKLGHEYQIKHFGRSSL